MSPKPQAAAPDRQSARVEALAKTVAAEARRRLGANARVIWFGSWVQGTAQPHSDIDLALDAPAPFSVEDLAALRAWVDDLATLYSIDIVDLHEVSDEFRARIQAHGVAL